MKTLFYDSGSITVAEDATELNGTQLVQLAKLFHSEMNMLRASLAALKILGNKSWFAFKRMPGDAKQYCLQYVQWIFQEWNLHRQLLPKYKKYYGPKDELLNLTLSEFYFTETAYADIVEDATGDALNNLIAVLYRLPKKRYDKQKDFEGDIRQPFTAAAISYYAKKTATWRPEVKQAILLFYDGCRKKISEDYPEIFQSSSSSDDADMFGILRGLAGGKYGDFEKVEQLPLHTALREIQCLIAEEERMKMELQKA